MERLLHPADSFLGERRWAPRILVHAGILDVDVASAARVEEQVPARVMIVVVDIDAVVVPFPIAAVIEVDRGDHPIRIVVEHDAAGPEIHSPRDEFTSHVFVAAVRIRPPRPDTVVVGIPVRVRVVRIVPAFVISVVMPIATVVSVFVIAFVLPVVVAVVPVTMVIAILIWCGDRQRSSQSQEHTARYYFAHKLSLQKWRCPPIFLTPMVPYCRFGLPQAGASFIYCLSVRLSHSKKMKSTYLIQYTHPPLS